VGILILDEKLSGKVISLRQKTLIYNAFTRLTCVYHRGSTLEEHNFLQPQLPWICEFRLGNKPEVHSSGSEQYRWTYGFLRDSKPEAHSFPFEH